MWTKAELINFALRKMGIASGVQASFATADMLETALIDYEPMVSEFAEHINIRPYKTNPPDINDYTGLSDVASQAMAYQLGLRIAPDYLVEPTPAYAATAHATMERLRLSLLVVPELQRRSDMPFGQGWKSSARWGEFYTQSNVVGGSIPQPVKDVQTYTIDFTGDLQPNETITSFQLRDSSRGTVIEASSFSGNVITYRVKFENAGANWVAFQVAGDQNTVATQRVDFDVQKVDEYA